MQDRKTNILLDDQTKYVLDQTKIEVEHTRSWPTKVMAFYTALHFGLATAVEKIKMDDSRILGFFIITVIFVAWIWILKTLFRNHESYLKYRNLQIAIQRMHLTNYEELTGIELPSEWFEPVPIQLYIRANGWAFYAFIATMVSVCTGIFVWLSTHL